MFSNGNKKMACHAFWSGRVLVFLGSLVMCCQISWAQVPSELLTDRLQIVSPMEGAVFSPGETITIVVEVAPNSPFTHIGAGGEGMLSEPKTVPPFEFAL